MEEKNVKDVEQNDEEKTTNVKSNKSLIIVLAVIIIVLLATVGITLGLLFSGDKTIINNNNNNNTTQTNNENSKSKKIDESKPWVYDADYHNGKEPKKVFPKYSNYMYDSVKELKVPYININSEYAKEINRELKELFDEYYNAYGKAYKTYKDNFIGSIDYEVYQSDNLVSICVEKREGVANSGIARSYLVYNFNLNRLNKASLEDLYKQTDFETEVKMKNCMDISINNYIKKGDLIKEDVSIDYNKLFINKKGILSIILRNPSGNDSTYEIYADVSNTEISNINNSSSDSNRQKAIEDIKTLILNNLDPDYPGCKSTFIQISDIDGMPAYIVDMKIEKDNSHIVYLITYQNNKAVVYKKDVSNEYKGVYVDSKANVLILGDLEQLRKQGESNGIVSLNTINNKGFNEYAYTKVNETDGGTYTYINNEYVSYGTFVNRTEGVNLSSITMELNNDNVNKYSK